MNIEEYTKLINNDLHMYNTTELLDAGVIDALNDFIIIDKSMYCNNCAHYGSHCGTFGWCTREAFPNDDGCAGYIKTPIDFCCSEWKAK